MNELALFAGAGGGILAGHLLGWSTVCAVEIDDYRRRVLMQRQDDGLLEPFPIWPDIRTFDGRPWARCVDIVTGGFPCQDISSAGKRAGIDGTQSGLWSEMARVVREVRPRFCLVENSPMLTVRELGRVLWDLAEMGFDAEWGVLGADDVGAPHIRKRIWIVAYATRARHRQDAGGAHGTYHGEGPIQARQLDGDGEWNRTRDVAESAGRIGALEPVGPSADVSDAKGDGFGSRRARRPVANAERQPEPERAFQDTPVLGPQARQSRPELGGAGWRGMPPGRGWWDVEPDVGGLLPDGLSSGLGENLNGKTLRSLWQTAGKETLREATRRQCGFRPTEILQSLLHGYLAAKRQADTQCHRETQQALAEVLLRDMRRAGEALHSSLGWQPLQQRTSEFEDALYFLSHLIASQTGRFGREQAGAALSYLRAAIVQVGTMFHPSNTLQEAWRSLDSQWKASLVLGRWTFEPPIPRIARVPHHAQRLSALGDAQVPAVAALAWRILSGRVPRGKAHERESA